MVRTNKQLGVLRYLQNTERKTKEYWYREIADLVSLYQLCLDDKDDLCQIYRMTRCKYRNSPYLDLKIWAAINKHIGFILDYRRLFVEEENVIEEVPVGELDRYVDFIDYSNETPSWDDFDFSPLNQEEQRVIELFFRHEKSLTEIAVETGAKYITVAKRFERGLTKLRDNKQLFLLN